MARGDGIHRTSARNMRLTTPKLKNAQQHNEREKESYVNQDIVPERSHLNIHFKHCFYVSNFTHINVYFSKKI